MTTYIPQITLPAVIFEKPAASILLPVLAGTTIGYMTRPQTDSIYKALKQPPLNPPAYVFGPVWTALYAGMGYAAYRAYTVGMSSFDPQKIALTKQSTTLYTLQLSLNLLWMPLFFGMGRPIEATADIVALTGVTGYLAYIWAQVDETAAWCLAPYLAWLGFATYLCAGCGYLNGWNFKHLQKKTE
ncbi:TspO/MBR-related protein [Saccharata proteae CBS 121410]|uniref:TspO/MBR-related protein n=1 Tax=Saccharata proteae CBS 121410 TaxID=1314787 RepID=A0A9P4HU13_9PEZI|nr:TspO/MBR-related protein [Saccharata proteae CBS 121410]